MFGTRSCPLLRVVSLLCSFRNQEQNIYCAGRTVLPTRISLVSQAVFVFHLFLLTSKSTHLLTMQRSLRNSLLVLGTLAASLSHAAPYERDANVAAGAIYTLYNNATNASIIAMSFTENGTLYGSPVMTPTGGKGGIGQTGPGQPNVGALFSSNAVCVEDNVLIFEFHILGRMADNQ